MIQHGHLCREDQLLPKISESFQGHWSTTSTLRLTSSTISLKICLYSKCCKDGCSCFFLSALGFSFIFIFIFTDSNLFFLRCLLTTMKISVFAMIYFNLAHCGQQSFDERALIRTEGCHMFFNMFAWEPWVRDIDLHLRSSSLSAAVGNNRWYLSSYSSLCES